MEMNSPTGKRILALVRNGDFAHPGEQAAVDLLMTGRVPSDSEVLLDVGCGRGGTLGYLRRSGWGRCVGVDVDEETIEDARLCYPDCSFLAGSVDDLSTLLAEPVDLICLWTSFYAFEDQSNALRQMRAVAKPSAELRMMDYALWHGGRGELPKRETNMSWTPLRPAGFAEMAAAAGWEVRRLDDISEHFVGWYRDLVGRIRGKEAGIRADYGEDWFRFVVAFYSGMLETIEAGEIGGALVIARAA
jgi:SAM-dependent methyltransferase